MKLILKPCKCGGKAEFHEVETVNTAHNNRIEKTFYAQCLDCGLRTNDKPNKTWAMKAWNGRVYKK